MRYFLILLWIPFSLFAQDKGQNQSVQQSRENIRKTLQTEIDTLHKEETWSAEKDRLVREVQLLKMRLEDLKKENKELESAVVKAKEDVQSAEEDRKNIQQKHQVLLGELKKSVEILTSQASALPDDENFKQMLQNLQSSTEGESFNPVFLMNDLCDFHQQWWQMGQSFQIRQNTVLIDGKEYHGEVIRLGLVYRFLLFADQSRWAYFDAESNAWKFGSENEYSKVRKIKNILTKQEPVQVIYLPKK